MGFLVHVGPQQDWDFYPCRVDGAPASISLNLWFLEHPAPEGCNTLVHAQIDMHDPGDHGMGTRDEARSFRPIEDAMRQGARAARFHLVGRVRTRGVWQLAWYGPDDGATGLRDAVSEAIANHPGRRASTQVLPDPEWSFLHEFLAPDETSIQWMEDRRIVDRLLADGDRLEVPRPIDHEVVFEGIDAARGFAGSARRLGFIAICPPDDPSRVQLQRTDVAVLSQVHDVARALRHVATRFGGIYEGWSSPVVE